MKGLKVYIRRWDPNCIVGHKPLYFHTLKASLFPGGVSQQEALAAAYMGMAICCLHLGLWGDHRVWAGAVHISSSIGQWPYRKFQKALVTD